MFELIGGIFASVVSGGATGLLGILLQRFFDMRAKAQEIEVVKLNLANSIELAKMEHEQAKARMENDLAVAESVAANEQYLADRETEVRLVEADSENLQASMKHDGATYLDPSAQRRKGFVGGLITFMMAFVDFMRGVLRPAMTAYLCGLTTVMFFWVRELAERYGTSLTPDQVHDLMFQIIVTILYVWTVVATWWFGARPPAKR